MWMHVARQAACDSVCAMIQTLTNMHVIANQSCTEKNDAFLLSSLKTLQWISISKNYLRKNVCHGGNFGVLEYLVNLEQQV